MVVDALSLVPGGRARPELVRGGARRRRWRPSSRCEDGERRGAFRAKLEAAGIPAERELVVRRVVQAEGRSRALRQRAPVHRRAARRARARPLRHRLAARERDADRPRDPRRVPRRLRQLDAALRGIGPRGRRAVRSCAGARGRDGARARAGRAGGLPRAGSSRRSTSSTRGRARRRELEHERGASGTPSSSGKRRATPPSASTRARRPSATSSRGLGAELDQAAAIDGSLAPLARAVESARAELADAARALARYAEGVEASPERLPRSRSGSFACRSSYASTGRRRRSSSPTASSSPPSSRPLTQTRRAHCRARSRAGEEARRRLGAGARALEEPARCRRAPRRRHRKRARAARHGAGAGRRRRGSCRGAGRRAHGRRRAAHAHGHRSRRVSHRAEPGRGAAAAPEDRERRRAVARAPGAEARAGRRGARGALRVRRGRRGRRRRDRRGDRARHRDIARHRQVLCVTHLPQIAALASAHFVVDKAESNGRTFTTVRRLTDEQRSRRSRA